MFRKKQDPIDLAVIDLVVAMRNADPTSVEYMRMAASLKTIMEAKGSVSKQTVSPDVLVSASANLLGMGLIMNFEKMNVISTKAFGFLPKLMR